VNLISPFSSFRWLPALLLGSSIVVLAENKPKSGGILHLPLGGDISSIDPARCYELPGELFVRVLYQGLVDYDDGVEMVPDLAKSWTISADGLIYTFELDPRARFSNGSTVVADDYLFSFDRMLSPKMHCPADFMYFGIRGVEEYRAGKSEHISGVEAPSPYKLVFRLLQPDLTFLYRLAMPFAAPVCKELLKDKFSEIGTISAGAGPFKLKEWNRGARIQLVRNPYYGGACPAFVDELDATIGIEDSVAQMMFERRELDIMDLKFGVAGAEFPRIKRTPEIFRNLEAEVSSAIDYLALNTEIPPLDNKLVRKAFNYAINKQRLVEIQSGRSVAMNGPLPPVVPGFNPNLKGYEYSPEKARTLLAEAGFPNGFTTSVIFPNVVQENFRVVAALQEDLRQVGVILEANPLSFPAYIEKSQRRKTAAVCYAAWSEDFPDPSNYLDALFNGETISERDCQNLAFYNNPEVNGLLKTAASSLNVKERLALYQKAEALIVEDAPWVFLVCLKQYVLHQPWVRNTKPHVVWPFRFEKMWIDR
jgi:oligopeptide transport system substrate-binding protein